ncbi:MULTISPECIES: thermosome subunit alpha [Methanothrix]|uniref:Thermosome beta subunit n=4 Tax=Methanothrix TaxID=2222 RepID=F4BZ89_METSG|nr:MULTISPECIES: thermosome subunit alpha [Methanothrix]AEB67788.1 thermosome beta subunit [Methanothrix soehngenii GP6]UEC41075.1 MAG: Thermosome subunit alpha [Methanothrix sp.]HNT45492.1 thermosome subunit alpha [Methanothrix soehngenii]HOI21089.1 thermosome subunit alpha [Methanothrix soehngenii]HPL19378.1 thermosome subunit alpha [Methanothrix soehngenii]
MAGLSGVPVIIMKEGSERESGKNAQHRNILAAKAVAEAVRTTLGPKGMDKMLIDGSGDATITNDGATILREMDIENPVAKMIVEVAKAQDDEIGDGTTTAVIIAGKLLEKAEALLEQDVHPTVIVQGYKQAAAKAQEVLKKMAIDVSGDQEMLLKIARTSIRGKGTEMALDRLSQISVDAARAVVGFEGKDIEENIKMVHIPGGRIEESSINYGIVLEKERTSPQMPKSIKNARIMLLEGTLELKKLGTDAKITITEAKNLSSFKEGEEKIIKEQVDAIIATGANVVFCEKGIGVFAQGYLANRGILAARRVKREDLKMLALATGAKLVGDVMQLRPEDLGSAALVEERRVGKEKQMIFVEGCEKARAISIILHGVSDQLLEEMERALDDSLNVVMDVIRSGKIVPGGGAPEILVAENLRQYASTLEGREQLAIRAFADAVEAIPFTLAENSGFDPVDSLAALRANQGEGKIYGLDIASGKPADMMAQGVVEPLKVKTQAIKSAAEAATMVLRVDDVIAAKREEMTPKPGQSPHDYTMPQMPMPHY